MSILLVWCARVPCALCPARPPRPSSTSFTLATHNHPQLPAQASLFLWFLCSPPWNAHSLPPALHGPGQSHLLHAASSDLTWPVPFSPPHCHSAPGHPVQLTESLAPDTACGAEDSREPCYVWKSWRACALPEGILIPHFLKNCASQQNNFVAGV